MVDLRNKTIVFTGTMETMTRHEARGLAERCGASVTAAVKTGVDILVAGPGAGSKAGSNKVKAYDLGLAIIDELQFLQAASDTYRLNSIQTLPDRVQAWCFEEPSFTHWAFRPGVKPTDVGQWEFYQCEDELDSSAIIGITEHEASSFDQALAQLKSLMSYMRSTYHFGRDRGERDAQRFFQLAFGFARPSQEEANLWNNPVPLAPVDYGDES